MRWIGVVAALALITLVGCGGDDDAGVAATGDDGAADSPTTDQGDGPQLGDHWHLAVGFSRRGEELPVLEDAVPDEAGIHSHFGWPDPRSPVHAGSGR